MKTVLSVSIFTLLLSCSAIGESNAQPATDHQVIKPVEPVPDNNHAIFKLGNTRLILNLVDFYNHFATKSLTKGSLAEAEETLLKKAIPLSVRYGSPQSTYNCFMALAKCYLGQKMYTQAKWYFIQSNIAAQKAKYRKGEVLSLIQLAGLKKTIGDDSLALADLKEAQRIAVAIKYKTILPGIKKSIAAFPATAKKSAPPAKSVDAADNKIAVKTGSANQ